MSSLSFTFCPHCAARLENREIDGRSRLACCSCDYVNWNNPTPVVAGLVQLIEQDSQGETFVLARNADWPTGMFSLITGFLEQGEKPEQAIAREAQEELGVHCVEVCFLGHFSLPRFNQLIIAYHLRTAGPLAPGAEIAETLLLSREALAAYDFGQLELTTHIVASALAKDA